MHTEVLVVVLVLEGVFLRVSWWGIGLHCSFYLWFLGGGRESEMVRPFFLDTGVGRVWWCCRLVDGVVAWSFSSLLSAHSETFEHPKRGWVVWWNRYDVFDGE